MIKKMVIMEMRKVATRTPHPQPYTKDTMLGQAKPNAQGEFQHILDPQLPWTTKPKPDQPTHKPKPDQPTHNMHYRTIPHITDIPYITLHTYITFTHYIHYIHTYNNYIHTYIHA